MQPPMRTGEATTVVPATSAVDAEDVQRGIAALGAALNIKPQGTGKRGSVTVADEAQAERARRTAVREVLQAYPCIWPRLRRMLSNAEDALLGAVGCNRDSATGQVLIKVLKHMRDELGYQEAPLLERLLIEHIALAWLDLDAVQQHYAKSALQQHALAHGAYWDRRMNSAQQRYLRAIETLARVRRLARVTPLQVNIGGQQVNVVDVAPA